MTGPGGRRDQRFASSHPRGPYYWPGGAGVKQGSGGLGKRTVYQLRSVVGGSGLLEGELDLAGASGVVLLSVETQTPSWVRLYASSADRAADSARTVDEQPTTPIILDALFLEGGPTEYEIFDGDEWGALAFNKDDFSQPKLYYSVQVTDPAPLAFLFRQLEFDQGEWTPGTEPRWSAADWSETKGLRWRYYEAFGQMRPGGTTNEIAVFSKKLNDPRVSRGIISAWRNNSMLDSAAASVIFCSFLKQFSEDPSELPHLELGVIRKSPEDMDIWASYRDSLGINNNLIIGTPSPVPWIQGQIRVITAETFIIPGGVGWRVSIDGIEWESGEVPPELLALSNHDYTGILVSASDPPEAPLGFGALAVEEIVVEGATTPYICNFGASPIEAAGGTLTAPPASQGAP